MRINNAGQSLFEVVIAVGISALIITGVVVAALNSIQNSAYAKNKSVASNYVQETMDWLRKVRDVETQAFKSKAVPNGVYCMATLPSSVNGWPTIRTVCPTTDPIPNTNFIRSVEFLECTGCPPEIVDTVIRVKTTVSWQDSKGTHEVSSTTDLSVR